MVKRKTIEERMKSKPEKKTNRDKLIQALKDNDIKYLLYKLSCYACEYCDDCEHCNGSEECIKGTEKWLDQEVSDE